MLDIEIVKECIADYYYREFKEKVFDIQVNGEVYLLFASDKKRREIKVKIDLEQESIIKYVDGVKVNTLMFATDKAYENFLRKMNKNKLIKL